MTLLSLEYPIPCCDPDTLSHFKNISIQKSKFFYFWKRAWGSPRVFHIIINLHKKHSWNVDDFDIKTYLSRETIKQKIWNSGIRKRITGSTEWMQKDSKKSIDLRNIATFFGRHHMMTPGIWSMLQPSWYDDARQIWVKRIIVCVRDLSWCRPRTVE